MPIKAILQNIDGTPCMSNPVDGLNRCLPSGSADTDQSTAVESFPLLQEVDAYCDLVFNQSQMPQLLEELDLLMNGATGQESRSLLEKVRELAMQCRDSNHPCLLRIVGD